MSSEVTGARNSATTGGRDGAARSLMVWQVVSALFLLGMAYIHLHLVLTGVGGVLGKLFVLNAIGGLVLGIAMVVLRQQLLLVASVLSLLFMAGTLLALLLALTVGLFGISESWDYQLVPTTIVVESVGAIVLAITAWMVYRTQGGWGRSLGSSAARRATGARR
jgi:hypothetical protein